MTLFSKHKPMQAKCDLDGCQASTFQSAIDALTQGNAKLTEALDKALEKIIRLSDMDNKVRAALCDCKTPDDHEDECGALKPIEAVKTLRAENERLREALNDSVALQSHYAKLLNFSDGGDRKTFTVESWMERLDELNGRAVLKGKSE